MKKIGTNETFQTVSYSATVVTYTSETTFNIGYNYGCISSS